MGPGDLDQVLCELNIPSAPNVLVGMEHPDDAAVYRLRDDLAIIQTIDFFTPLVNDPYDFGQIAAANALSDVYAMGGQPLTAMNVVCFPSQTMDLSILREIIRGGLDKLNEAGVVLVGGHSVDDPQIKYGLSVTGTIHPEKVVTNAGARPGDALVLTKPLGTGIISTAIKAEMGSEETVWQVTGQMATLNKQASEFMLDYEVHACTDITGFGLLGHASEMIRENNAGFVIESSSVPLLDEVAEYAAMGLIPAGTYRNKEFYSPRVDARIPDDLMLILFDAQTSGGLLISLPENQAESLVGKMHEQGVKDASIIGRVVSEHPGVIQVR